MELSGFNSLGTEGTKSKSLVCSFDSVFVAKGFGHTDGLYKPTLGRGSLLGELNDFYHVA